MQRVCTWPAGLPCYFPSLSLISCIPPTTPLAQNPVLIKLWIGPGPTGLSGAARRLLDAERIAFKTDADGNPEHPQLQGPGLIFLRAERWAMHREGEAGAPKVLEYDICEWRRGLDKGCGSCKRGKKTGSRTMTCWQECGPGTGTGRCRPSRARRVDPHPAQQLAADHAPGAVMERSAGGVPASAVPLVLTAVGLVVCVAAVLPWWTQRAVPCMLACLAGSGGDLGPQRRRL